MPVHIKRRWSGSRDVACSRWEADAVDYRPADRALVRAIGRTRAVRLKESPKRSNRSGPRGEVLDSTEADVFWQGDQRIELDGIGPSAWSPRFRPHRASFLSLQQQLENRDGVSGSSQCCRLVSPGLPLDDPSQVAMARVINFVH